MEAESEQMQASIKSVFFSVKELLNHTIRYDSVCLT